MDRGATRPTEKTILILGNGARGLDWTKFGIPIITTRLGIDLIESDNPLFAGRFGLLTDIPSYLTIQNAEKLICVGARLDVGFTGWDLSKFAPKATKIIVDIDEEELKKTKADIKYHLTAKEFHKQLQPMDCSNWINQIHTWQKKYPLKLTGSYKAIRQISDQATKDDVIVVDTSGAFHIAAQVWQIKKGQRYITTGGISTMGYWPASIGASLASGKRVICITGDGCFQMNIQELATVVKNKLNIKIFVLNNDGYLLIRHTQKKYFNRLGGESPKTGLGFPSFDAIAYAYNIKYLYIRSEAKELGGDIADVLNAKGPVLCEIFTPKWEKLQCRLDSIQEDFKRYS